MAKYGITVRHAVLEDHDRVIQFIKEHWKEDHIFVLCPELFDYYHVIDGKLTYVIAEDDLTEEIYGLQGYIASNRSAEPDVWGAIWKTIPCSYPFLGVEIMKTIRKSTNCRIFAGVGANPNTTIPLLKFLKEATGKMDHYYRLANQEVYQIAVVNQKTIPPLSESPRYKFVRFNTFDELRARFDISKYRDRKPYKDAWYVERRYYAHPMNHYDVYGIDKGRLHIESIVVAREQWQNGAKVLRLLDFIGQDQDLTGIGHTLQGLLEDNHYEYVDFYCKGLPHEVLTQAGFALRDAQDSNIIPNYFEPFVRENIDIYYNTSDDGDYYVFKGDSDQDRPSIKR